MTIRQMISTVTVAAPGDPYGTLTTFPQGKVLSVDAGSPWETAIGTANMITLSGSALNNMLTGSDPAVTDNS